MKQEKKLTAFALDVIATVKSVPRGRVATYGQIAWLAGHPGAARHVGWILHSSSNKHRLPWHRIIGASGGISLKRGRGLEEQRKLLRREGVEVGTGGRVDLEKFLWEPGEGRRAFLFALYGPKLKKRSSAQGGRKKQGRAARGRCLPSIR